MKNKFSSNTNTNKKIMNKNTIIIILVLFIIFLFILFYLFDVKNIRVQKHLESIYSNTTFLKNKYINLINNEPEINSENDIYIINNFLKKEYFMFLKSQFDNKTFISKNFRFRKATGINFFDLHENNEYTGFLELYYSTEMSDFLASILKKPIQKPPLNDMNACSLLIYNNKGDFIDWHKDYSLYNGDRYVVLLTIVNENSDKNGLSQNEFIYKYKDKEYPLKLLENSIIIFKGSEILHKSTSIDLNERRILLSMTFCDVCQEKKNIIQYFYEKIKNFVVYE
jgi:hypothetical protein